LPLSKSQQQHNRKFKNLDYDSQTQGLTVPDVVSVLRENVNVTRNKVKIILQTSNKTA
jgi:hypothetical protein